MQFLGLLVGNLNAELLFERHDQFDRVKGIRAQVLDKRGCGRHLLGIDAEFFDDDFFDSFFDGFVGHKILFGLRDHAYWQPVPIAITKNPPLLQARRSATASRKQKPLAGERSGPQSREFMRTLLRRIFLFLPTALALVACAMAKNGDTPGAQQRGDTAIDLPDPVAIVEGQEIPRAELQAAFDRALASMGIDGADLTAAQRLEGYREVLDYMVLDRLVDQRAKDTTVTDADVDAAMDDLRSGHARDLEEWMKEGAKDDGDLRDLVRKGLQTKRWMESQIVGTDDVPEKDLRAYYDSRKTEFQHPELVRASQILIRVPEDAKEDVVAGKKNAANAVLERVTVKNEDFAAVAKEVSEAPGAKESGGDLDFFPKDRMVPEFAEAAFAMQKGEISKEPVRSKFGWHIIKVTDRRPAGVMSFEDAKKYLRNYFREKKRADAIGKITDEIRAASKVEIRLPAKPAATPPDR